MFLAGFLVILLSWTNTYYTSTEIVLPREVSRYKFKLKTALTLQGAIKNNSEFLKAK